MARPVAPAERGVSPATLMAGARTQVLNGRGSVSGNGAVVGSAAVYRQHRRAQPKTDRRQIAKDWQVEAYRHVNICGEARYAVTLFAAIASRAEIGVSEAQTKVGRPAWVDSGPEVDLLASVMPSVRDRSKFIRDYMTHRVIAGEAYLIARTRQPNDPGYVSPPGDFDGTWEEYARANPVDLFDGEEPVTDPNTPIWELVAVTELRKRGETWEVRYDNDNYIALAEDDPVVRVWWPDPDNRREAWSPIKSLLPTLREIEWLTKHIFTQIRSRLISAGVWFVPDNITFPPPPPDAVEGGAEALAAMNEAEQFMISLADSGMSLLDADEVAFPTVVMASPEALAMVDQKKLIQFWSELDDTAMKLRSDNIRRFALGMDMPPEQILGASGMAVSGSAGAAGSTNHWSIWAAEEQTISAHIEPALDDFVHFLTLGLIRRVLPASELVVSYDTSSLRLRQDRSKESIELYDRGALRAATMVRENGFDPTIDMMDDAEFRRWLLVKIAGGSATPEQVQESLRLLGVVLNVDVSGNGEGSGGAATAHPGTNEPRNLDEHPYEGPPRVDHDHNPAPYSALLASCEGLVLRALERAGNRVLNDHKRGRDKDRTTPAHLAHMTLTPEQRQETPPFDFGLAPTMLAGLGAADIDGLTRAMGRYCRDLYASGDGYDRETLSEYLSAGMGSR